MSKWAIAGIVFGIIAFIILFALIFVRFFSKDRAYSTKFIVRTGIFAAMSIILYCTPYLKFSVPFFPSFLELHFDEIPALISGLAYGPISALFVLLVKTIVKLPMTTTLCVGEIADLVFSLVYIIPASLIYRKRRDIAGAFIGICVGTIFQVVVASIGTSFLVLDFYIRVMGLTNEQILEMCQSINPKIESLGWPFCYMIEIPFNLFKDMIVGIVTFILYKRLHKLIDKIGAQKN